MRDINDGDPAPGGSSLAYLQSFLTRVMFLYHVFEARVRTAGDHLLDVFAALANPHRLRVLAALSTQGRSYVSQLARDIGISRPLLHLHLRKLEDAGLVHSTLELSSDGKALKFFEVAPFQIAVTPAAIVEAARTLATPPSPNSERFDP